MAKLPVVDEAERERIREALIGYKEQHGSIGDPELQQRMMRALECDDRFVPLSTIQRFLKGTHRTSDLMVRRYRKFLEQIAPPHPGEEYVTALTRLFVSGPGKAANGRYLVYSRPCYPVPGTPPTFELPVNGPDIVVYPFKSASTAPFDNAYSTLVIKPVRGAGVLNVSETILPPRQSERHLPPIGSEGQAPRKGLLIPWKHPEFLIVSRGRLETMLYMLKLVPDMPATFQGLALSAHCAAISNWYIRGITWQPAFEIRMTPARDNKSFTRQGP